MRKGQVEKQDCTNTLLTTRFQGKSEKILKQTLSKTLLLTADC